MSLVYIVDPKTKETRPVPSIGLADAGFHERGDLQEWVLNHPEILGEPLCIISSEFAAFDRANRRIDILALDAEFNLVVIELKRSLDNTFADLQALRYASFCSTMTAEQVVAEYASYHGVSEEEAGKAIKQFLQTEEELSEPGDRPRIILVAGEISDAEILSTALWLRKFDLDIRCIELTPHPIGDSHVLLVPQMIVPLREAEEYQVRVERKESAKARKEKEAGPNAPLWRSITEAYERLGSPRPVSRSPRRSYFQVLTGNGEWHYEWQVNQRADEFHVAIHFESSDPERNYRLLDLVKQRAAQIQEGIPVPFRTERWGKRWAFGAFVLPWRPDGWDEQYAEQAAQLMVDLIKRTWPWLSKEFE